MPSHDLSNPTMTSSVDPKVGAEREACATARRVLRALYVAVDERIARDVEAKVTDAFRALEAENDRLEKDSARLDAMERYARANADNDGFTHEFAEVSLPEIDIDDEEDGVVNVDPEQWQVAGPRTRWGSRLGEGATLRDAIDDAMRWEGAENLDDLESSEPAASLLPERGTNGN